MTIVGVGELIFFEDPEGNVAGAMRYGGVSGRRRADALARSIFARLRLAARKPTLESAS